MSIQVRKASYLILLKVILATTTVAAQGLHKYTGTYGGFKNLRGGGETNINVIGAEDKIFFQFRLGFFTKAEGKVSCSLLPAGCNDAFVTVEGQVQNNKIIAEGWDAYFEPAGKLSDNEPGYKLHINKLDINCVTINNETRAGHSIELDGLFPRASLRYLTTNDLKGFSKKSLMVMRNEIFYRYQFIFKKGGQMDLFFKEREPAYYFPYYANVDKYLTDIEKKNIQVILAAEKNAPDQTAVTDTVTTYITGTDELQPQDVQSIKTAEPKDYVGKYHYGESEGESTLTISIVNGRLSAKEVSGEWAGNTWKTKTVTYKTEMKNGVLYLNNELYELVSYKTDDGRYRGLMRRFQRVDELRGVLEISYEIGYRQSQ